MHSEARSDLTENLNSYLTTRSSKPIWLYGAYGTGKSHTVFVLKHLLEDPENEVEEYLRKFSDIIGDTLVKKLMSLRKQGVLVVFRSSAGHIDNAVKLLLEVQQSIYDAYRKLGSEFQATQTLVQNLLKRLNDEMINWDKLIEKHKR
jgi:ABC-type dipeptide/oligopeptide/nickel transport system ATPase component